LTDDPLATHQGRIETPERDGFPSARPIPPDARRVCRLNAVPPCDDDCAAPKTLQTPKRQILKITMDTKNTPVPWGIEETDRFIWVGPLQRDGSGKVDEIVFGLDVEDFKPSALEKARANAALIVEAVNGFKNLTDQNKRYWRATTYLHESLDLWASDSNPSLEEVAQLRDVAKNTLNGVAVDRPCPDCGGAGTDDNDGQCKCDTCKGSGKVWS
jgi:hypothetical protein